MNTVDRRTALATLWIFVILNYLYADVLGLMDAKLLAQYITGTINNLQVTPVFLLLAGLLMETAMVMVPLSRLLPAGPLNRWLNVGAALIHTLAVTASLFVGAEPYYIFFSAIEISATLAILGLALTWKTQPQAGPVKPQPVGN